MQETKGNQVNIKKHIEQKRNNMHKRFIINVSFERTTEIPINGLIASYIEDKILEYIFIRNNILINTKWSWLFGFFIVDSSNALEELKYDIRIHMVRTDGANNTKVSGANVPDCLIDNNKPKNEEFIRLLLLSLKMFLQQTYPKINEEKFAFFYNSIDFKYLYSLSFPAPINDRKYDVHDW